MLPVRAEYSERRRGRCRSNFQATIHFLAPDVQLINFYFGEVQPRNSCLVS